jgi:hypothetical protein
MSPTIRNLVPLLAVSGALAYPTSNQTSIHWGECTLKYPVPVECAKFPVPLDYTDESAGELVLSLVKAKAVKAPFEGSILVNPGGPGQGGIDFLRASADIVLE